MSWRILTGAKRPDFELSGDLSPEAPVWIRRWTTVIETAAADAQVLVGISIAAAIPLSYPISLNQVCEK